MEILLASYSFLIYDSRFMDKYSFLDKLIENFGNLMAPQFFDYKVSYYSGT